MVEKTWKDYVFQKIKDTRLELSGRTQTQIRLLRELAMIISDLKSENQEFSSKGRFCFSKPSTGKLGGKLSQIDYAMTAFEKTLASFYRSYSEKHSDTVSLASDNSDSTSRSSLGLRHT